MTTNVIELLIQCNENIFSTGHNILKVIVIFPVTKV